LPSKYVHTEIEGQKIRLSNLSRVIYPEANITKAEIIQYAIHISDELLKYIKDRPLTLIRFPDGINKERFYAKQKPDWTPDWVDHFGISHTTEKINYIVPKRKADVVWLANLSALELHPMQFTTDQEEFPDHFIFDLDPPEGASFAIVKEIAFLLKDFLIEYGYTPFVKTSGSKGAHIFVPIKRKYSHEEMTESVKALANSFVKKYPELSTLHMNKLKRENKVLMDIFRNHKSHTTVAPYSLRGKPGGPISMPLSWDKLNEIDSAQYFTIRNYKTYFEESVASWASFFTSAVELHDRKKVDPAILKMRDEKLKVYYEKRNFNDTPEPQAEEIIGSNNRYAIQLHDASNLHYDLRLEDNGTLLSWAIPKGLPIRKGVKRMAIRTEDHPLNYLTFEGIIPKGNYGAGEMWVYEHGTFKWLHKEEKKIKIELNSGNEVKQFHLFKTKGDQWLAERISASEPSLNIAEDFQPMLAEAAKTLLTKNYDYEIKWDGIRAIIHFDEDRVTVTSRGHKDLTEKFPELQDLGSYLDIEQGVFDGEIVCLDEKGRPVFSKVISRMHTQGATNIELRSQTNKAVIYLFDCLMHDGKSITHLPLTRRRAWLKAAFKKQETYRYSNSFDDGPGLLKAVQEMGLEGIMMKIKDGQYHIGSRSSNWLKLKTRHTENAYIIGYTKGKGDRSSLFGSLHLAVEHESGLKYMGRVGSGFNTAQLEEYYEKFQLLISKEKPIEDKVEQEKDTVWMRPELMCEIRYASMTNNDTFREPIFVKMIKAK